MTHYVYFIFKHNHNECKIGWSDDPEARCSELQKGSPDKLAVYKTIETNYPTKLKAQLHNQYINLKIRGGWFRLTKDQVDLIADRTDPETGKPVNQSSPMKRIESHDTPSECHNSKTREQCLRLLKKYDNLVKEHNELVKEYSDLKEECSYLTKQSDRLKKNYVFIGTPIY